MSIQPEEIGGRSLKELIQVFKTNKVALAGLIILAVLVGIAIFADFIAPYDPFERVGPPLQPPSEKHLLGTNDVGQDIFSELIYGARISLMIGFIAAAMGTILGTIIGIVSGYFSGPIDEVLMRLTDIWLSMPTLLFTIFLASVLVRTPLPMIYAIATAIALTSWPSVARLVRSATLSIKENQYVESARALGASNSRIMFKHIMPNIVPLIIIEIITGTATAMLTEASLSFLGLGDPTAKSWGTMIYYAMERNAVFLRMWWWLIPPGIMISIAVLAVMLVGMGLEEFYNPRLRKKQ